MFTYVNIQARSLAALAAADPTRVFWWFVTLHLVLWTLLSYATSPNAPLDVIEGYIWGREWLWGTYKHPPMQAWLLEIMAVLTGRAHWAHFLASQIAVVAAFWAVWQTGRRILGEQRTLIGVLLLEGVIYYNFTSPEFNPNVLQMAFWALAGYSFYRAIKDNRLLDWAFLGVWSAAGLYSKYSTVLLLGVFAILTIQRPEARRCLKKPGPYVALLITLLLFMPHLAWLGHHDFMPFTYVKERLNEAGPATQYVKTPSFLPNAVLSPVVFIVGQILALLPALLLLLVLDGNEEADRGIKPINKYDRAFLTAITFTPILLTLAMAIIFGFKIHDMWGAPFFNFAGLWAVAVFFPKGITLRPRFAYAWSIVFFAGLLGIFVQNFLSPYITGRPTRVHFPGHALAQSISDEWRRRYAQPLAYVIGDTWPAGNVAYYAPDRPHVFLNADSTISPWINPDELKAHGAVIVWCENHCTHHAEEHNAPGYLQEQFPEAIIQPSLTIPRQSNADLFPVTIGWAIVPPHESPSR